MKISRYFTKDSGPYDGINFVKRTSRINRLDGNAIFENSNVIVPDRWSQVATDILAQKYFRRKGLGKNGTEGENDSRQVFERLTDCWKTWGVKHNYFDTAEDADAFKEELQFMLANQMAAPNSPQWFNTGLFNSYGINGPSQGHYYVDPDSKELKASTSSYERPQPHACFIQSIKDDLVNDGGIMDLWTREARLFKYGSGTGTNFSNVRGANETLSGGGKSSGLMSFLVIGDKAAGAIKSGGTTRRAAKMVILNADHPDIETFVDWKVKEERKVVALAAGSQIMRKHWDRMCKAYEASPSKDPNPYTNEKLKKAIAQAYRDGIAKPFISQCLGRLQNGDTVRDIDIYDTNWDSEAYLTVNGMNSNNSVRLTNDFMDSVKAGGDWNLTSRTGGHIVKTIKSKELWDKIVKAAWFCADPGLQFDTTINEWHTCLNSGRINGSNPCCITGDTLISVADGRISVPIKELVGTTVNVYTWDSELKKTVIAPMYNIGVKRTGASVYRVTLDDGSSFKATEDHLIMLKEGGYRKVEDLLPGDSLNPLHGKLYEWAQKGHTPRWYTWSGRGWHAQYRMIWEYANGPQPKKMHIHHKDWNAQNDSLENLELLTPEAHTEIHVSHMTGENNPVHRLTEEQKLVWKEKLRTYFTGEQNPNFGKTHSSKTKLKMVSRWTPERKEATRIHMTEVQLTRMASGEEVGRPKHLRHELSCAVCRNKFSSMNEERLYCSALCGVRGTKSLAAAKL
jgi:ribonucleoside-diphosphate reductase alpha chain